MRANWPGVVLIALLTLLLAEQTGAITIQPKHDAEHQRLADGAGQTVRPESADERLADYTEWLAFFTAALVVVSTVQIGFLIRADKTGRIAANAAKMAAEAAGDQVRLAKDTAEAPLRAYLSVEAIFAHRDKGEIGAGIKNNGRTPAKLFVAHCWIDYNDADTVYESSKAMLPEGIQIAPDTVEVFIATGFDPIPEFDDTDFSELQVHVEVKFTFSDWFDNSRSGFVSFTIESDGRITHKNFSAN